MTLMGKFLDNTDSAYLINMSKGRHTFFCKPDVPNFKGKVTPCRVGPGETCSCARLLPKTPKMVVTIDSFTGKGRFNTGSVTGGDVYFYDGHGFEKIGSKAEWITAMKFRRRLDTAAPKDQAGAASMLTDIAKNTKITLDLNKLFTQIGSILKSDGSEGAIVINMHNVTHTFYCKPDV